MGHRDRNSIASPRWTAAIIAIAAVAIAASLPVTGACSKGGAKPGEGERGTMSSETEQLIGQVPASAFLVAYVDSPQTIWEQLMGADFLFSLSPDNRQALDADLRALFQKRLGMNLTRVKTAVAFMEAPKRGAALVRGVSGKVPGRPIGTHAGAALVQIADDVIAANRGDILVIGADSSVRAALDAIAGTGQRGGALADAIRDDCGGGLLGLAVTASAIEDPKARASAAQFGIEGGCARIGRSGIHAVVRGDSAKLTQLAAMAKGALQVALIQADKQKSAMSDNTPLPEAFGATVAYHYIKHAADRIDPQVDGDRMQVSLPLDIGDPTLVTALIGVSTAVAIPALMKYIQKSKSAEARRTLQALYERVRAYHMRGGAGSSLDSNAKPAPLVSVGPTPPIGACCHEDDGTCAPNAALWDHPTWRALQFSVDDPHHYSYEFQTDGSRFAVRAIGDLDCDGVLSKFEMIGVVGPDGQIQGSATPLTENEHE